MGRRLPLTVSWKPHQYQRRRDGPPHPEPLPPSPPQGFLRLQVPCTLCTGVLGSLRSSEQGYATGLGEGVLAVDSARPRPVGACPVSLPDWLWLLFPVFWPVTFKPGSHRDEWWFVLLHVGILFVCEHPPPLASIAHDLMQGVRIRESVFSQTCSLKSLWVLLCRWSSRHIWGQWRLWRWCYWWALQLRSAYCGGGFCRLFMFTFVFFFFTFLSFCFCSLLLWPRHLGVKPLRTLSVHEAPLSSKTNDR